MQRKTLVIFALILLLAFTIRFQNIESVFSKPILPSGYDPYYQIRLAEVIVKSGYRPQFDYYLNYPYGLKIGWLPLFSYVLAIPGFIGFKDVAAFDVVLPVILGLISTVLVYLITAKIFNNDYIALISSLFFAICPAVVSISMLGFADHHIWNLMLILFAAYFILYKDFKVLISGVFLTLLAFSWVGSPIYAALLALCALMLDLENSKQIAYQAIAFAIPSVSFVLNKFLGFTFLALSIFIILGHLIKRKGFLIHYIAACAAVISIAYFLPFKELSFLKAGINYLLSRNIYLPTIVEAQSFQVFAIISNSGYFIFLMALPSLIIAKNRFLSTWFISAIFLALLQLRFADILSIPVSILSAYTLAIFLDKMGYPVFPQNEEHERRIKFRAKTSRKKSKKEEKKKEYKVKIKDTLILLVVVGYLIAPAIILCKYPFTMNKDWRDALLWIKDNTEKTSYYLTPDKGKPEYSIMSWWDYGNWIVYLANRPVVCNNFQAGAVDAAKFFTAQDEKTAIKIAKKRTVKYVITAQEMGLDLESLSGKFIAIMQIAGLKPKFMNKNEITDFYNNSMFYKLHIENAKTLKHFKLIKDFGSVKVFKVVY